VIFIRLGATPNNSPAVRPLKGPAHHGPVSFGKKIFDGDVKIREGRSKLHYCFHGTLGTCSQKL
jgi:hypothetical protein